MSASLLSLIFPCAGPQPVGSGSISQGPRATVPVFQRKASSESLEREHSLGPTSFLCPDNSTRAYPSIDKRSSARLGPLISPPAQAKHPQPSHLDCSRPQALARCYVRSKAVCPHLLFHALADHPKKAGRSQTWAPQVGRGGS